MSFAPELPDRLNDLGHAAAISRMIIAQPAPISIERQLPYPGDQIAVSNEPTTLAFGTKSKVFQADQDRNGKTVVDRGVLNVARLHPGFRKCARPGAHRSRKRQIDV